MKTLQNLYPFVSSAMISNSCLKLAKLTTKSRSCSINFKRPRTSTKRNSGSLSDTFNWITWMLSSSLHFAPSWKMMRMQCKQVWRIKANTSSWDLSSKWWLWIGDTGLQRFLSWYVAGKLTEGILMVSTCTSSLGVDTMFLNAYHYVQKQYYRNVFIEYKRTNTFSKCLIRVFQFYWGARSWGMKKTLKTPYSIQTSSTGSAPALQILSAEKNHVLVLYGHWIYRINVYVRFGTLQVCRVGCSRFLTLESNGFTIRGDCTSKA